ATAAGRRRAGTPGPTHAAQPDPLTRDPVDVAVQGSARLPREVDLRASRGRLAIPDPSVDPIGEAVPHRQRLSHRVPVEAHVLAAMGPGVEIEDGAVGIDLG